VFIRALNFNYCCYTKGESIGEPAQYLGAAILEYTLPREFKIK
jgi:hypothetical protein